VSGLTYALVTPARDEADNLRRLGPCLVAQTVCPTAWVIVDDGSTDGTADVVSDLARRHEWIHLLRSGGATSPQAPLDAGRRSGRDVLAFSAGVESLSTRPDVVVKVDADVSFEPDYFERLLNEFDADPSLGIASGECYEEQDGSWVPRHVTSVHVRGASRAYRWACLCDVLPLEQRLGWDGIDEIKANVRGWSTRTIAALPFRHHRSVGQRDGAWRAWSAQGETAHYMGYRLSYLVLRAIHHARREPNALAMIGGYFEAALRRQERCADADVRGFLRRYQSPLRLHLRAREALGQRSRY
jgi:biofilm PGA synthesis N-glycosyltransferase PgaC